MSSPKKAEESLRVLDIGGGRNEEFCTNFVRTTKYTLITFLPKNLFEQFRRVANLYFLIMACLASVPQISPINAATSWMPLIIVIGVTAFREAYEDYKRYRSDVEMNGRQCLALRGGKFEMTKWSDIKVGDLLKIRKNHPIRGKPGEVPQPPPDPESSFYPADLVLLNSSERGGDGGEAAGICFIETKDLDGETNLKTKKVVPSTVQLNEDQTIALGGRIECTAPNEKLENFQGILTMRTDKTRLTFDNLLLRGSNLKNTDWIIGVVVYTGLDTKVMRNMNKEAPSKRSGIERSMNKLIIGVFVLLFLTCFAGAIGAGAYVKNCEDCWYLDPATTSATFDTTDAALSGLISFFTYFILLSQMVPISLYVQVEIVKTFFAILVSWDLNMFAFKVDLPARANTSNLGEELGQVEYIFSDKTGTLTQNKLELLKCSINGKIFGKGTTEVEREKARNEGKTLPPDPPAPEGYPDGWRFDAPELLNGKWREHPDCVEIYDFFMCLALCHDARVEKADDGTISYPALSPDESTLVRAAKYIGFEFIERKAGKPGSIVVEVGGERVTVEILAVFPFDSDRKRSSAVVRFPDGRVVLYMKGAETMIFKNVKDKNDARRSKIEEHLQAFAAQGLRTLTLAKREIDLDFVDGWYKVYTEATSDEALAYAAALVESNDAVLPPGYSGAGLVSGEGQVLGATAIEDRLQEEVGKTISVLRQAGIKIWVLTGDVTRTAIEIGYACALIQKATMEVLILEFVKGDMADQLSESERKILARIKMEEALRQTGRTQGKDFALVCEGAMLTYALLPDGQDGGCRQVFISLTSLCKTVICCRVSPRQKADVTRMVKENQKVVTLAIGDGANDVAMIQAAHIGIGIKGIEGSQAALAADYAFGEFRFLAPLLLEHGHWSYTRVSTIVCFSFYKNILFALTLFWFSVYCAFSGQPLYDDLYISCYNLFFTSLQVFGFGLFERDASRKMIRKYPWLYKIGQRNDLFSPTRFASWVVTAIIQSVMVHFFTANIAGFFVHSNARVLGMFSLGTNVLSNVIFVVTLTLAFETRSITSLTGLAYICGILTWVVFICGYNGMKPGLLGQGFDSRDNVYYIIFMVAQTASFWLSKGFCLVTACFPQVMLHALQTILAVKPDLVDHPRMWFRRLRRRHQPLPDINPFDTKEQQLSAPGDSERMRLERQIAKTQPRNFTRSMSRADGTNFVTFGITTEDDLRDYVDGFNYNAPPAEIISKQRKPPVIASDVPLPRFGDKRPQGPTVWGPPIRPPALPVEEEKIDLGKAGEFDSMPISSYLSDQDNNPPPHSPFYNNTNNSNGFYNYSTNRGRGGGEQHHQRRGRDSSPPPQPPPPAHYMPPMPDASHFQAPPLFTRNEISPPPPIRFPNQNGLPESFAGFGPGRRTSPPRSRGMTPPSRQFANVPPHLLEGGYNSPPPYDEFDMMNGAANVPRNAGGYSNNLPPRMPPSNGYYSNNNPNYGYL